jgi:hypothetical protein
MKSQEELALYSDQTLREVLALFKLRNHGTSQGTEARKAIEDAICTKLDLDCFDNNDWRAVTHALDPYPNCLPAEVELSHRTARLLSLLSEKLTGCRDIGVLMDQIASGQRRIY